MATLKLGPGVVTVAELPIIRLRWKTEVYFRKNFGFIQCVKPLVMERIYHLLGQRYQGEDSLPGHASAFSFWEYITLAVFNGNLDPASWKDTMPACLLVQQEQVGLMGPGFWDEPNFKILFAGVGVYAKRLYYDRGVLPPYEIGLPTLAAEPNTRQQSAPTHDDVAEPYNDGLVENPTIDPSLILNKVPDAEELEFPGMQEVRKFVSGNTDPAPPVQPTNAQEPQAALQSHVVDLQHQQQGLPIAVPAWAVPTKEDHAQLGLRGAYIRSFEAAQKTIQLACEGKIRLTTQHVNDKDIVSGSVFVYKCTKVPGNGGMSRWSDRHNWTASRKGKHSFRVEGPRRIRSDELFYRELTESKHKGTDRKSAIKPVPELDAHGKRKRSKSSLGFNTHVQVDMSNLHDTLHLTVDELQGRDPQEVAEELLHNYTFDKGLKFGGLVKRTFTEIHNAGQPDECSYRVLSFYTLKDVCSNQIHPFEP